MKILSSFARPIVIPNQYKENTTGGGQNDSAIIHFHCMEQSGGLNVLNKVFQRQKKSWKSNMRVKKRWQNAHLNPFQKTNMQKARDAFVFFTFG